MKQRRRLALAAALLTLTAFGTAACSSTVPASHVAGPDAGDVVALADPAAAPAVLCTMRSYLVGQARGLKLGTATPGAIATAVKDGEPTDVVILPAGAALDRVRDELTAPPARIATPPGGTSRWVAAVTDKGLRFAQFLSGRQGRSLLLRSSQCTVGTKGRAG